MCFQAALRTRKLWRLLYFLELRATAPSASCLYVITPGEGRGLDGAFPLLNPVDGGGKLEASEMLAVAIAHSFKLFTGSVTKKVQQIVLQNELHSL